MKPTRYLVTRLADSAMREQIAGVVIHWNILELQVERIIADLKGNPGVVKYEEDLARRLELLKRLSKQTYPLTERLKCPKFPARSRLSAGGATGLFMVFGVWIKAVKSSRFSPAQIRIER